MARFAFVQVSINLLGITNVLALCSMIALLWIGFRSIGYETGNSVAWSKASTHVSNDQYVGTPFFIKQVASSVSRDDSDSKKIDWHNIVRDRVDNDIREYGGLAKYKVMWENSAADKKICSYVFPYDNTSSVEMIGIACKDKIFKRWYLFLNRTVVRQRLRPGSVFRVTRGDGSYRHFKRLVFTASGCVTLKTLGVAHPVDIALPKWPLMIPNWQHVENVLKENYGGVNSSLCPWKNRSSIPIWRGSLFKTKGNKPMSNTELTKTGGRPLLVEKSFTERTFDARFSHIHLPVGALDSPESFFKSKFVDRIPKADYYSRYKYVIIAGGIAAAFRLTNHLAAGQLVILQDFRCIEWFTNFLVPWKHYIPVKQDWSDLSQVVEFIRLNEEQARKIAQGGRQFFEDYLDDKPTIEFVVEMVNYFDQLLKVNNQVESDKS